MQLNFLTISTFVMASSLLGCATSAPELPLDYGSVDAEIKLGEENFESSDLEIACQDIAGQLSRLKTQQLEVDSAILESRVNDQIVGIAANLILTPLWLVIDNDNDLKAIRDVLQERSDTLTLLFRFKSCS